MVVKKKVRSSASHKTLNAKGKKKKVVKRKVSKRKQPEILTVTSKKIKPVKSTLDLRNDKEIASDFAVKIYKKFERIIKSVILFGSVEKREIKQGSDIDLIILIDDVSLHWDQELIAWYREELDKIVLANPYKKTLHINTVKLSTWWDDLLKGDPIVLNVLRNGMAVLDYAGFFQPLKYLLLKGKIKGSTEAIYECVQRAPKHLFRSKAAELSAIEGVYWAMVDSAHAALIAMNVFPPSPEHVPEDLIQNFVSKKLLDKKYVQWYREIYDLHKKIEHKKVTFIKGQEIDVWQNRAHEFLQTMIALVSKIIEANKGFHK